MEEDLTRGRGKVETFRLWLRNLVTLWGTSHEDSVYESWYFDVSGDLGRTQDGSFD